MNYKPFAGYWFYGAANDAERPNFYASWGLLADAPAGGTTWMDDIYVPKRWFAMIRHRFVG